MNQDFYGLPPPEAPDPERLPLATVAMVGGLVVAALIFVIAGVGFVVGWWGPNSVAEPVSDPEPAPVAVEQARAPEPVELAGAELIPTAELRPNPIAVDDSDPFAGAEPVPEIAPAKGRGGAPSSVGDGTAAGSSGTDAASKPRPPRVRVQFVLGSHYERVELKLGGKVLKLAGDKHIDLPPGGYRVELRKGPEASWAPAGLITLELGNRYQVTLLDPPLAKLERIK